MKRIVQMIPSHHAGDAAGSEVLYIETLLKSWGWEIENFADNIDSELVGKTRPSTELKIDDPENTIAIYHFCVSSPMSYQFRDLPCRKIMIYHNVTPAQFYQPYDEAIADVCRMGRQQAGELADVTDLAIAHSEYSRRELVDAGYKVTRMIPFLLPAERTSIAPDEKMMSRLGDRPNVLFVGRLAPNKCPDEFINVAKAYHDAGHQPVRFLLVGNRNVLPSYTKELDALIEDVDLGDDQLLVTGKVSDAELMACYASSTIFLSMSRHEGFCVPLLEAMRFGLPVMARAEAAVPETLGEAGILFTSDDPAVVADSVEKLITDQEKQQVLLSRSQKRLEHFDTEKWSFVLRVLMERFASERDD